MRHFYSSLLVLTAILATGARAEPIDAHTISISKETVTLKVHSAEQGVKEHSRTWDNIYGQPLSVTLVELIKDASVHDNIVLDFHSDFEAKRAAFMIDTLQKRGVKNLGVRHRNQLVRTCAASQKTCFDKPWAKHTLSQKVNIAVVVREDGVDIDTPGQLFDGASQKRTGQALVPKHRRAFRTKLHNTLDELYVFGAPTALVVKKNASLTTFLDTLLVVQQPMAFASRSPFARKSERQLNLEELAEGLSFGELDVALEKQKVAGASQVNTQKRDTLRSAFGNMNDGLATLGLNAQKTSSQKSAARVLKRETQEGKSDRGDPRLERAMGVFLSKNTDALGGCFATQRRTTKLVVEVTLHENGKPKAIAPNRSGARAECVSRVIAALQFPETGKEVTFQKAFVFQGRS